MSVGSSAPGLQQLDRGARHRHLEDQVAGADSTLGWCDYQAEFEFVLDLILDGLDRLRGKA